MPVSHRLESKRVLLKLLNVGWQSWSTSDNSFLKLPLNCFLPFHKKGEFSINPVKSPKLKKPAYGWCSWYIYGQDINEEKILTQSKLIVSHKNRRNLPLEYILIDDGWCTWGDWLIENRHKFPKGLKNISKKIKGLKLKPGVWIAPFLVDPKSLLALEHPDWLVRKNDRLVEGVNLTPWDRYFPYKKWILNIKNPQVIKYLDDSIEYLVKDCGFELIKLDFLYSIFFDPNLSRTEANTFLRHFLYKIKTKYPKVYTLACGCPLIPAVGVIDSMRIGPDTSLDPFLKFLLPQFFSRWYLDRKVIPTLSQRLWTKKLWRVDPDAFLCRKSLGYTHDQLIKFQKVIKAGDGNIFLGDDLTQLSSGRIRKYLLPLFDKG